MKRALLSIGLAASTLFLAGVGIAGPTTTDVTGRIIQYNPQTGEIVALLPGGSTIDVQVVAGTIFGAGQVVKPLPPSPCRGLFTAWNILAKSGQLQSHPVLQRSLLTGLAKFKCSMEFGLPSSSVGSIALDAIRPPTAETGTNGIGTPLARQAGDSLGRHAQRATKKGADLLDAGGALRIGARSL